MENITIGRYEFPDDYIGWLEPESREWIVYVRKDHVPEIYLDRDPDTGAIID